MKLPLFQSVRDPTVLHAYLYAACNTYDVMPSGIVINSVKDAVAVISKMFESAHREIVFVTSPSLLSIAGTYDTVASARRFIEEGGVIRGITTVSRANVDEARMRMAVGLDLRHNDRCHELSMFVCDEQHSISGINPGIDTYTLDTPVKGFWSEDPAYAAFLLAYFEDAWSQAVPGRDRIQELLKQHPRKG